MKQRLKIKYPPIAIGCCFYKRPNNYQTIIRSIEKMAMAYKNKVQSFIYFSGENKQNTEIYINNLKFESRNIFTFEYGPDRFDEPKYKLPLASRAPFIFTTDDDLYFTDDTLTILMDVYNSLQVVNSHNTFLSPIGWFGTIIKNGKLMMPIEGRYNLAPREIQKVDFIGSGGCLYRREILQDKQFNYENWPAFIKTASDLWLSFLLNVKYKTLAFITGLNKKDLPEHGHSLWEDINSKMFPQMVSRLVSEGWEKPTCKQLKTLRNFS